MFKKKIVFTKKCNLKSENLDFKLIKIKEINFENLNKELNWKFSKFCNINLKRARVLTKFIENVKILFV